MTRRPGEDWSTPHIRFRPVRRELCIVEHPSGPCVRPQKPGSQLCRQCDEETDRLAAKRVEAGWPT